jgi:DNA-binding transcriptional LysR family regulator
MEEGLGGPLFMRDRNNTNLTHLGRLLEPHLTEVFTHTEAAVALSFNTGLRSQPKTMR